MIIDENDLEFTELINEKLDDYFIKDEFFELYEKLIAIAFGIPIELLNE